MATLHVCFLWHMHQPSYADPTTGEVLLPWVRLHAVKDYTDMAMAVEAVPEAHVTFNWVPGLWDQIDATARDLPGEGDLFARLTSKSAEALGPEEEGFVRRHFFSLNHARLLAPWPRYRELFDAARAPGRMSARDLRDLQVWFNLAWCGEGVRARPEVAALCARGRDFSEDDKVLLLATHRAAAGEIQGRYEALAAAGRIELTCSPYYHPILPLLIDTHLALASDPGNRIPRLRFRWPGDAVAHIRRALASHAARFGRPPRGLWPSEGAVTQALVGPLAQAGLSWMASDAEILARSLRRNHLEPSERFAPWRVGDLAVFFRDRGLSDRLGFEYGSWWRDDAIADLCHHLCAIRAGLGGRRGVVTLALDGENCWETYPGGVMAFLPHLYRRIAATPGLRLSTFSEALEDLDGEAGPDGRALDELASGSWIDGTFRTWMGDPAKNRAWDHLTRARDLVGRSLTELEADDPVLADLVLRAEASDWFWWLGAGNTSTFDGHFDQLARRHIAAIYERLGRTPPPELGRPLDPLAPALETPRRA